MFDNYKMLIDGFLTDAASSDVIDVENPATGEIVAQVPSGRTEDIDAAVAAARRALDGVWREYGPAQRTNLLLRLADRLESMAEEFAQLETLDVGQPLFMSRMGARSAADVIRYNAGWASKITGETITPILPGDWHAYTLREPVGVVGLIVPWNAPYSMTVSKLSALLAAGCTAVVKPAEQTPLSTLRLAQIFKEVGFPDGVINIVPGYGPVAGAALVAHPGIDKIAFTGSTETGRAIMRSAASSLKRVSLELGGKSPVIILPDADLDVAIPAAAAGIFMNSGQVCVAGSRLYVHRRIFDQVVEGVAIHAQTMEVGPGTAPGVQMGPLVSRAQLDRVTRFIDEGCRDGAQIVTGGTRIGEQGYFMAPTVLVDVRPDMSVMRDEIFGPVIAISAFEDESLHAIACEANDSDFGLAASIWTRDISAGHKLAKMLRAGSIKINAPQIPEITMPFGGFKQSGLGRENGWAGIEAFTELKSVMVAL